MVIPIGDENPRAANPVVSWGYAAALGLAYLAAASGAWPVSHGPAFFLSPLLAPDPVSLVWSILAIVIFADNVEDRIGPGYMACLLVGAGWIGAASRELVPWAGAAGPFGRAFAGTREAGAPSAAVAVAVAYAVLFPLHQIRFFHVFGGRRRRTLLNMFDDRPSMPSTFYLNASTGIFLWGLGILAAAIAGPRTSGDLLAACLAAAGGFGTGIAIRTKFGHPAFPAEIEAPAQIWRGSASAPESPAPRYVAPKPFALPKPFEPRGWAVLRETDELFDVGRLGRIVAKATGEVVADATRRIRQTRGVLARGLSAGRAQGLARELAENGIPAFAVDEAATGGLPQAQNALSCGCGSGGLEFDLEGGRKAAVNWGDVAMIAAARIDQIDTQASLAPGAVDPLHSPAVTLRERITQTTLIDVVTHRPPARLRVARQEASFGGGSDASSAGFRQFAGSVVKYRGATPVNKGVSVIAGRGAWGYLAFQIPAAYEEYLWWLLQVIRHRSGAAQPQPEAPGGPPAPSTSYLE
ncbi:MAG: hypothetical protein HYY18_05535 [Planctomycetes bacterium]|nr:hypothetical protein [Planctomycetota bacterium]